MCGRMTQQQDPSEIARIFDAEVAPGDVTTLAELGPRYNVAPTQPITVVVAREAGRQVEAHRWGLGAGVGQVGVGRLPSHQRACRNHRRQPSLSDLVHPAPLPDPGRRLLRVAARRPSQAAVPHSAGRHRKLGRPTGLRRHLVSLARARQRGVAADGGRCDHGCQRDGRPSAQSDARDSRQRRVAAVAGPDDHGRRTAAGPAPAGSRRPVGAGAGFAAGQQRQQREAPTWSFRCPPRRLRSHL